MAQNPNVDILHTEGGWLDLLSEILLGVLNVAGEAGSRLFSALWPHVVNAWTTARNFVIAHPRCTLALIIIVLGVLLAQPLATGVVEILGFGAPGVWVGSIAAQIQARLYGGFVPAGSIFASLQSFGAL